MNTISRPNILVILSDELQRGALGCYGDRNVSTPCIDGLAQDGVRFANSCSTYPICVPFRFTMMTGECAHSRMIPGIEWRMSPAERTLADEFNEAGYETLYVGKWHLYGDHTVEWCESNTKSAFTPVPRRHQGRWQKWLGFELRNAPFDTYYFEDDDPTPRKVEGYQTDGLFDLTMGYLRDDWDRSKPFCCVLSVEPPHFPLEAPEEYEARWRDKTLELPPGWGQKVDDSLIPHGNDFDPETLHGQMDLLRTYYAMIENLDTNVGRLRQFLKDERLEENTIIVFVSDHGDNCGAHGLYTRSKNWAYETASGIPLIIYDPTAKNIGSVAIDPTNTEDLFPTLLGLAGFLPANDLPGTDLTGLIRGDADHLDRAGVMLEYDHDHMPGWAWFEQSYRGFRSSRFKYTVAGPPVGAVPWQFFDLERDPHEMHNVIAEAEYQDEIARHHKLLRDEMVRTEDHLPLLPAYGCLGLNLWRKEDIGI
jgi:arylsulfatase A-like enzyme